jgi:hypothetical protein
MEIEKQTIEKTEASIKKILDEGLTTNNLDTLYKLSKIKHIAKEDKNMNYGNYGNYYGNPGYDNYGRRGYDMKYRGNESLDRMAGEYGRYMESYGRYGASQETDKSFHYMVEALKDFIKVLHEEADTPQQKQMLQEAIQKSMMM